MKIKNILYAVQKKTLYVKNYSILFKCLKLSLVNSEQSTTNST